MPFHIRPSTGAREVSSWQDGAGELFENARALDQSLNKLLAGDVSEDNGPDVLQQVRRRLSAFHSLAQGEAADAQ
ncbi:MAG TPA: hypothetical protein VHZ07_17775 [Bryobacteraceae bacterium]|nr:hypothetical protein [Bryobacteraceae bacterium]